MNPRISSGLIQRATGPSETDAPKGRLVMVAGPAGRGPTEPQLIENQEDAYRIYGDQGSLADDIALALRGAQLGSASSGTNQVGQVLAVRTETGTSATLTLQSGGVDVMTLKTATSGTQANQWSVNPKDGRIELYDPESEQTATFNYDPSGTSSDITTPSQLADAIQQATSGRIEAEVHRGHTHFELSLSDQANMGGIGLNTSDSETSIDFSDASIADLENVTEGGNTAIGNSTQHFDGTGDEDPVHNFLIPDEQDNARFYAITAGGAASVPEGVQEAPLDHLADAKRVGAGTNSLLNLHSMPDGSELKLTDAGKRGGNTVSEGFFRVRKDYSGRLDTSRTVATQSGFADYNAEVAANEDPSAYIGTTNAASPLTIDSQDLAAGDKLLVFGQGINTDGLYTVADDSGDLYLEPKRHRTAETLSQEGATVDVANGSNSGLQRYDAASGVISEPELVKFTFEAPFGVADEDAGSAGTMATAYANYLEGDPTNADDLSVNRITPEGTERFEAAHDSPLKIELAPITNQNDATEYTGDMQVSWSDATATVLIDKAELDSRFDDALVYVSYDTCVLNLPEKSERSALGGIGGIDYTVDGQTLVFSQELPHELVVRPLRVTQYRKGYDLEIRRTGSDGNRFVFTGQDNQPGAKGEAVGSIETILGFEYDYEPTFPPAGTSKKFSGATTGVNASAKKRAEALEEALREHGKRDHDIMVASGLFVDELQNSQDPVTGEPISKPVGVLSIIERHQQRMSETGASPIAYTSIRPMQQSTTTGRYTDAQKRARVANVAEPAEPGESNTASIIQSDSRPEVFIFDTPMEVSVGGGTIRTSSPAFWAGLRSTLSNTTTLYKVDLTGIAQPVYKYDVAGAQLPGKLSEARVNTWDPRRGVARLADEKTAAGYLIGRDGSKQPNGWQSGIALIAAKEFQQDSIDQLENLLGSVPSGGVDVLRGTVETMLRGVSERTGGVQQLILNPQQDIQIRAEGGNSLGMYITVTLLVNGELRRIDLQVGAVTEANQDNDNQNQIPVAQ